MKYLILALLALAGVSLAIQPGLYHDPAQPGHGVQINTAPDNHYVLTWFTYAPAFELDEDGNAIWLEPAQAWFVSENWQPGDTVDLFRPLAFFQAESFQLGAPVGDIRVTPTESGIRVEYRVYDWPWRCDGAVLPGPAVPFCVGTVRLELLAGQ